MLNQIKPKLFFLLITISFIIMMPGETIRAQNNQSTLIEIYPSNNWGRANKTNTDQSDVYSFIQEYFIIENSKDIGYSVDIDGDTFIVGAWGNDENGAASGGAYVFINNGSTWVQQAYLTSDNIETNDSFGWSVAIDGNTIVVGAMGEASNNPTNPNDNSMSGAGAAYVFVQEGEKWRQQAYLKAHNPGMWDYFGWDVTISGNTIAVGAWYEDGEKDTMSNSGAVYIYERTGENWTQKGYLTANNAQAGDEFGASISLEDNKLVVGAAREDSADRNNPEDNSALSAGAAYVFNEENGVWTQKDYLKSNNIYPEDFFGGSVDISNDLIVVSASGEDAAYIFRNDNETKEWNQEAYLKADNLAEGDCFGAEVAISDDIILVGDPCKAGVVNGYSVSGEGAAYVFAYNEESWSQIASLKAVMTGGPYDNFGFDVAISGDNLLVGEPGRDSGDPTNPGDNSAPGAGCVYLLKLLNLSKHYYYIPIIIQ